MGARQVEYRYQPPVYGYVLAPTAAVVVLTAWTHPRGVTLALAVLAGCAGILLADLQSLRTPNDVHLTIGQNLDGLRKLGLTDTRLAAITRDNAVRLLPRLKG